MRSTAPKKTEGGKWIAPRGGGYRPGGEFRTGEHTVMAPTKPPTSKGGVATNRKNAT